MKSWNCLTRIIFFALLNLPYPTTKQSVLDHLAQEKFIAKVGDRYAIRRIGALLLAKDLQGFEDVKHKSAKGYCLFRRGKNSHQTFAYWGARICRRFPRVSEFL